MVYGCPGLAILEIIPVTEISGAEGMLPYADRSTEVVLVIW